MYDEKTRMRALELVESGMSAREASEVMGGKPSPAIISRWASGYAPTGKRCAPRSFSLEEKLEALERLDRGEHYRDIAADLGCSPPSVLTWKRIRDQKGIEALYTRIDRFLAQ